MKLPVKKTINIPPTEHQPTDSGETAKQSNLEKVAAAAKVANKQQLQLLPKKKKKKTSRARPAAGTRNRTLDTTWYTPADWRVVTIVRPEMRPGTKPGFFEMIAHRATGERVLCLVTVTPAFLGPHIRRVKVPPTGFPF